MSGTVILSSTTTTAKSRETGIASTRSTRPLDSERQIDCLLTRNRGFEREPCLIQICGGKSIPCPETFPANFLLRGAITATWLSADTWLCDNRHQVQDVIHLHDQQ